MRAGNCTHSGRWEGVDGYCQIITHGDPEMCNHPTLGMSEQPCAPGWQDCPLSKVDNDTDKQVDDV